jgi:GNAT superfamily N-acetyltransferase
MQTRGSFITIRSLPEADRSRAIADVSAIQAECLGAYDDGFLIADYSPDEYAEFACAPGSEIWVATQGVGVLAYCVVTDPQHLFEFAPSAAQRIHADSRYVAQLATTKQYKRRGLASALIDTVRSAAGARLVTDVIVQPIVNHASLRFFVSQSFRPVMDVESTFRAFGRTVSRVLACP